jgi:hypothetical protein
MAVSDDDRFALKGAIGDISLMESLEPMLSPQRQRRGEVIGLSLLGVCCILALSLTREISTAVLFAKSAKYTLSGEFMVCVCGHWLVFVLSLSVLLAFFGHTNVKQRNTKKKRYVCTQ